MKQKLFSLLLLAGFMGFLQAQNYRALADRVVEALKKMEKTHATAVLHRSTPSIRLDSTVIYDASNAATSRDGYWYDPSQPDLNTAYGVMDYFAGYVTDTTNYSYDSSGNLLQSYRRTLDASQNPIDEFFHKHTYDAQGRITVTVDSNYVSGVWDANKTLYANFNAQDYPQQIIEQSYDAGIGGYVNDLKFEITYTASGDKLSQVDVYEWNSGSWEHKGIILFSYDVNGNITERLLRIWTGFSWADYQRSTITITSSGSHEIHEILNEEYDFTSFSWKNISREIYEFDGSDRIIRHEFYDWDDSANAWIGRYKKVITYTTSGNVLTMEGWHYSWDSTTANWNADPDYRFVDRFDTTVAFANVVWPQALLHLDTDDRIYLNVYGKYYPFPEYKFIDSTYEVYNSGLWSLQNRKVYYYGSIMGVTSLSDAQVSVYPVPASDYLHFRLHGITGDFYVRLYDMTGKQVMQKTFSGEVILDISNLKPGIYTYRLTSDKHFKTGRLIIR